MRILTGFVLGILAVVVGGVAFIYSGLYNVAAMDPHNPIVYWALDTTMRRSVAARADEIEVPARFDETQIQKGLEHFQSTCLMCHGAPGVEPSEVGKGLRPEPPELAAAIGRWSTAELFWIAKHGIKMTGMPGFGETHGDLDLWAIVAFIERLPTLSPEEYQAQAQAVRNGGGGGHGEQGRGGGAAPEQSHEQSEGGNAGNRQ